MTAFQVHIANAGGAPAGPLIEAFDAWLSERLAEAHAARMDLAFRDAPLQLAGGETIGLFGWEYWLLPPGAPAPAGDDWTVYRLHGGEAPAPVVRHDAERRLDRGLVNDFLGDLERVSAPYNDNR